jgi:glycosyltransferase involved in cell wall biosynthesis
MARVLHILPHPGGGGETVVDRLEQISDDFEHRRAYLTSGRSPLAAAPRLVARRPRLAREARSADLVHVIGDTSALLAAELMRGRASLFGTHGLHLMRRLRGPAAAIARRRMRRVLRFASVCVCTSEPELRELRALDETARLELVPNGIPLPELVSPEERAAMRAELGLEPNELAVLYLGVLEARKDPLTAARAVRTLADSGESAVLLVAGDGPLRGELGRLSGPAVRPLGFRTDADRLLAAVDMMVMPSEREGLSLAVLEAMGRGVPVVVSDGPGNPEAVGDAGVVVPFGDSAALCEQLRRLAACPDERARIGERGRHRVAELFTIERWEADMRRVFQRALER